MLRRTLFSILLLSCLLAPIAIHFVVLKQAQYALKKEIKRKLIAGIDKSELVLLRFTEAEKNTRLKWKHALEFSYQGEMYDIVETEIKGDTTYYWCWWDYAETDLNKKLAASLHIQQENQPQKQENEKQWLNFFKSLYISYSEDVFYTFSMIQNEHNLYRSGNIPWPFIPLLFAPPEKA